MKLETIFHSTLGVRPETFIIAEVGVNHNGRMDRAFELIDAAKGSGADAVKFQAFIPEKMIIQGTPKVPYQQKFSIKDNNQYLMLERLALSIDQLRRLKDYTESKGLIFLASAFDLSSASGLFEMGMVAFKIPSGELTNLPLIREIAGFGKPLLISTGMASLGEVEESVLAAENVGNHQLALLHCVSSYPAPMESLNLNVLITLAQTFHLPVGFSDHTSGMTAAIGAVALGAVVIEKHFTLDRKLEGPDHQASTEPDEFKQLVRAIRDMENALGNGRKQLMPGELETCRLTRKSVVAAKEIAAGELITRELLELKRPGSGIPPKNLEQLLGKRARHRIEKDSLISWLDVAQAEEK